MLFERIGVFVLAFAIFVILGIFTVEKLLKENPLIEESSKKLRFNYPCLTIRDLLPSLKDYIECKKIREKEICYLNPQKLDSFLRATALLKFEKNKKIKVNLLDNGVIINYQGYSCQLPYSEDGKNIIKKPYFCYKDKLEIYDKIKNIKESITKNTKELFNEYVNFFGDKFIWLVRPSDEAILNGEKVPLILALEYFNLNPVECNFNKYSFILIPFSYSGKDGLVLSKKGSKIEVENLKAAIVPNYFKFYKDSLKDFIKTLYEKNIKDFILFYYHDNNLDEEEITIFKQDGKNLKLGYFLTYTDLFNIKTLNNTLLYSITAYKDDKSLSIYLGEPLISKDVIETGGEIKYYLTKNDYSSYSINIKDYQDLNNFLASLKYNTTISSEDFGFFTYYDSNKKIWYFPLFYIKLDNLKDMVLKGKLSLKKEDVFELKDIKLEDLINNDDKNLSIYVESMKIDKNKNIEIIVSGIS